LEPDKDSKMSNTNERDHSTEDDSPAILDPRLWKLLEHGYFFRLGGDKFTITEKTVKVGKDGAFGKEWGLYHKIDGAPKSTYHKFGVDVFDGFKECLASDEVTRLLQQLAEDAQYRAEEAQTGKDADGCTVIETQNYLGMAEKFVENTYGAPLIYYRGLFHRWTGTQYEPIADADMEQSAYRFLGSCYTETCEMDHESGKVLKVKEPFSPNIRKVHDFLRALRSVVLVSERVETPSWLPGATEDQRKHDPMDLFPCVNGLLNVKTRELIPHSPAFLSLNAVEYPYDPEEQASNWEKFVSEVFPRDEEMRATLQQEFGYLVSNDTSQQKFFAHLGEKRSGKGTIAHILQKLLGSENVVNLDLENLQQHFGLASFIGKRVAIIGDARLKGGDTSRLTSRLLLLSGEDAISIPRKNRDDWNGKLNVRVVINANLPPGFADDSGVIADRFIVLRFLEKFWGREDIGLRDRLAQELPGILNWALEGLRMLREQGRFKQPFKSGELIEMMRVSSQPIFAFIADCLEEGDDFCETRGEVYTCYKRWADANGHRPMSATKLDGALNSALPSVTVGRPGARREGRERIYRGVRLWKAERPDAGAATAATAAVVVVNGGPWSQASAS
jgi:putative DNA primase/helicase